MILSSVRFIENVRGDTLTKHCFPAVSTADVVEYYDKMSSEWKQGESEQRLEINTFFLADIMKINLSILDVGCGTGGFSKYYGDKGHVITGIDISPKMIDVAKKNNPGFCLRFFSHDIMKPFGGLDYDLVILCDSLEHFLYPLTGLKNSISKVKKGGHIYITWPHPEYRKEHLSEGQIIDAVVEIHDVKNLLDKSGFGILKEKDYGTKYHGLLAKKEVYQKC
ncbi:hypothetical protein LCGC14_2939590 [marine sediment metagenome]|uniref:Methyltransferase type 11 domain-containing protein n=1 Tax=marine sediment metagenome TaxID=412755 RepID=A0A0F8XJ31_9ZZZZ